MDDEHAMDVEHQGAHCDDTQYDADDEWEAADACDIEQLLKQMENKLNWRLSDSSESDSDDSTSEESAAEVEAITVKTEPNLDEQTESFDQFAGDFTQAELTTDAKVECLQNLLLNTLLFKAFTGSKCEVCDNFALINPDWYDSFCSELCFQRALKLLTVKYLRQNPQQADSTPQTPKSVLRRPTVVRT